MPQFDPAVWSPQLIWLAISFVALYFLMSRVALPRISDVLEEREFKISDALRKAEGLRDDAEDAADRAVLDRASAGQTGDDVARTIIEAATADVPHLRYQTSDFARAVVAQVRVDPTGDSIVAQMSAQIR